MANDKQPRRPNYLMNLYLTPVFLIFLCLFRTNFTQTAVIAAAVLTFPTYKLFSIIGKKYDFVYSFLQEALYLKTVDLNLPLPYKNKRFSMRFRELLLLRVFELGIFTLSMLADGADGIMLNMKAGSGFLMLFYIVVDCIFVCYGMFFGREKI